MLWHAKVFERKTKLSCIQAAIFSWASATRLSKKSGTWLMAQKYPKQSGYS